MSAMMTTRQLRDELKAHLDSVTPPPADLDAVVRRGRGSRGRRMPGHGLLAAAAVTALAVGATALTLQPDGPDGPEGSDGSRSIAGSGTADLSKGLRAYAAPSAELHMAGKTFPAQALEELDTDAVATPYGMVFYDEGRPTLFEPSGEFRALHAGPVEDAPGFSPTAKADSTLPLVAFAVMVDDRPRLSLYDLEQGKVLASDDKDCGTSSCKDVVIDAVDDGIVFVRDSSGTWTWDYRTGQYARFAGPRTRIADVRNEVVLYTGPAPAPEDVGQSTDWRLVPGAIDAQLTFDGRHVLYWSSTLKPSQSGGTPIVLEEGPADGDGLAWWSVDTDGSILVAVAQPDGRVYTGDNIVYDCQLPSGECEELGPLLTTSGDPMFIGTDM